MFIRVRTYVVLKSRLLTEFTCIFGKTSTWLYQRINGNKVNGKEARFTSDEAHLLQEALHDLGSKLSAIVLV
jgi:hypothetical protein